MKRLTLNLSMALAACVLVPAGIASAADGGRAWQHTARQRAAETARTTARSATRSRPYAGKSRGAARRVPKSSTSQYVKQTKRTTGRQARALAGAPAPPAGPQPLNPDEARRLKRLRDLKGSSRNQRLVKTPRGATTALAATRSRPNRSMSRNATTKRPNTKLARTKQRYRSKPTLRRMAIKPRYNQTVLKRIAAPQPKTGRVVQFRQPGNAAAKGLSPRRANKLAQLRALKNKSRLATKGVGMPYKPGSRYKQLVNGVGRKTTGGTATVRRPSTGIALSTTQKRPNTTLARKAPRYSQRPLQRATATKRPRTGGGSGQVARNRPRGGGSGRSGAGSGKTGGFKRFNRGAGGAMVAVGAIGSAASADQAIRQAEDDRRNGRISQQELERIRTQEISGAGLEIGKGIGYAAVGGGVGVVAGAAFNDALGTDPIDLAGAGIGDLINGTQNAKGKVDGMGEAFDKSLIKQTFTNPAAAGERVKSDVTKGLEDVGNSVISIFGG